MSNVIAFLSSALPSSSLPSSGPQADDTPGGLHINMWYLLSGLGTLITAILAVASMCPPGRKFLRWLGWLRESPGQLRRRAEGITGHAHAARQREPPPADSHGPPEERLSDRLWGEAVELFEEARRREREGWGKYLGACWRDIWVGLKRGGDLSFFGILILFLCPHILNPNHGPALPWRWGSALGRPNGPNHEVLEPAKGRRTKKRKTHGSQVANPTLPQSQDFFTRPASIAASSKNRSKNEGEDSEEKRKTHRSQVANPTLLQSQRISTRLASTAVSSRLPTSDAPLISSSERLLFLIHEGEKGRSEAEPYLMQRSQVATPTVTTCS